MGLKIKLCTYEWRKLIKILNYQLRINQQGDESAENTDEIQPLRILDEAPSITTVLPGAIIFSDFWVLFLNSVSSSSWNAFHIMYQKVTSLGSFLKKEKKKKKN